MKKKVIHLSYFLNEKSDIETDKTYSCIKKLYCSNSFSIEIYIYRHLFYTLNFAKLNETKIILDLGCGDGPFLPTLNKYGKRIIGLDFRIEPLFKAKNLINYKKYPLKNILLLNADGLHLPIKDKSINIVFCLETFEHIPNSIMLINEIYRILRDSGELFYSLPIEIGFSLLIRQIVGKISNFPRDSYTFKELFRNIILKKPPKRINNPWTHKNFDWRIIQRLINRKFKQDKIIYSPFPFLKRLNPTVIFKVRK